MTISMTKGLALCGLCALMAGAGTAASAQGDYQRGGYHQGDQRQGDFRHDDARGDGDHGPRHHARQAIMRQKMAYGRAVAHGNYRAAERAHLRARAIRHHVRAHREMNGDGTRGDDARRRDAPRSRVLRTHDPPGRPRPRRGMACHAPTRSNPVRATLCGCPSSCGRPSS